MKQFCTIYFILVLALCCTTASSNADDIFSACMSDDASLVHSLIKDGNDVNAVNEQGNSPIHWAAGLGHCNTLSVLLDNGANINAVGRDGNTSLHYAVKYSHAKAIKLLVENDILIDYRNDYGWTATYIAAINDDINTISYLIDSGARMDCIDNACNMNILKYLQRRDDKITWKMINSIKAINCVDDNGSLLIDEAIVHREHTLLSKLIEHGAKLDIQHGKSGLLPIHVAVILNDIEAVNIILACGADVNAVDGSGFTALHLSVFKNDTTIASRLMRGEAKVNALDSKGCSPAFYAARKGYTSLRQLLVQHGGRSIWGNK